MKDNRNDIDIQETAAVDLDDALKDKVNRWQVFWGKIQEATDDSEEKLDGKVFAISTGGIAILLGTMGLANKSLDNGVWTAVVSLTAFGIAMILNLVYYKITIRNHNKQFKEIGKYISNPTEDDDYLYDLIESDNKKIDGLSTKAIVFNVIGVVFFAVYMLVNIICK